MKILLTCAAMAAMSMTLSACGSDETTVIHEKPVIVNTGSGATPGAVEATCAHGYDNNTHQCY